MSDPDLIAVVVVKAFIVAVFLMGVVSVVQEMIL
tara:strand:+ start:31 stop:132 length:102 start_codon:yes stop_codon:yes gene_type:complete